MSKQNDVDVVDELDLAEEFVGEPSVEQGPTPAIAPSVGSLDKILTRYSHCDLCGGRLHFNYISDFSRNTTHEKSSCPECGLVPKQVLHRLQ